MPGLRDLHRRVDRLRAPKGERTALEARQAELEARFAEIGTLLHEAPCHEGGALLEEAIATLNALEQIDEQLETPKQRRTRLEARARAHPPRSMSDEELAAELEALARCQFTRA